MVSKFKSYLFSICFFIICLFNFSVGYGYLYLDLKNEDYVIDSNRREYFVEINRNSGANNIRYFKISPSSSSPINVQLDDLSVKVRKSSTPPHSSDTQYSDVVATVEFGASLVVNNSIDLIVDNFAGSKSVGRVDFNNRGDVKVKTINIADNNMTNNGTYASFNNYSILNAEELNNSVFGTFKNKDRGTANISNINNLNNSDFFNYGYLTSNHFINNSSAKFVNDNSANITRFENVGMAKAVNNGSLNIKDFYNDAVFDNNSQAKIEKLINKGAYKSGYVKNDGTLTVNYFENYGQFINNGMEAKVSALKNQNGGVINNNGSLVSESVLNSGLIKNNNTVNVANNLINTGTFNNHSFLSSKVLNNEKDGHFNNRDGAYAQFEAFFNKLDSSVNNEGNIKTNVMYNNSIYFENKLSGSISSKTFDNTGKIINKGNVAVGELTKNNGKILNHQNFTSNTFSNQNDGTVNNRGNMTIADSLNNKGSFLNSSTSDARYFCKGCKDLDLGDLIDPSDNHPLNPATLSVASLNNEVGGNFKNNGNLTIANTLTNKYLFHNYLSGVVNAKSLINDHNYKNYGNITVYGLTNKGWFNNKNTGTINSQSLNNNTESQFINGGSVVNVVNMINRGRFENLDSGSVSAANIHNDVLSNFINRGRVNVGSDFINNGTLSITSESRLSINGVYRQENGYVNFVLNSYTDDSLIKSSQMYIANNTILKLSHDEFFDVGVTTYTLMESDNPITFSNSDFQTFKNNIDASGLGYIKWRVELSEDKKKLLLHIDGVSYPRDSYIPLTSDEKYLIGKMASIDSSKVKHPYLKKMIQAFKNPVTSDRIKKIFAQSLPYTSVNASVSVVQNSYGYIVQKILSGLNGKTNNGSNKTNISMNYMSSTRNDEYFLAKDMYMVKDLLDGQNRDIDDQIVGYIDSGIYADKSFESSNKNDNPFGIRLWADGLYSIGKYNHGTYDKFKTNMLGFIAGVDKEFVKDLTIGLSVATSNSDTKDNSFSLDTVNVNVSVYSVKRFNKSYFTNILSYGYFKHDQNRTQIGELLGAKYNTSGVSLYAEYKYLLTNYFDMKGFARIGLNKQSDIKEITKSGIGGMEKNVDAITYNDVIFGYGMEYNNRIYQTGKMALIPFASANYEYNFAHNPLNVVSYFADIGPDYKFVTKINKNNLHKLLLSGGLSFARSDMKNPLITRFAYSLDVSSMGYAHILSLKFIKSF